MFTKQEEEMHIISSSAEFFRALLKTEKLVKWEYDQMTTRLGVKPPDEKVVVLVIAENEWDSHTALFDLFDECEKLYGKQIDQRRIRYVSCKDISSAKLNPHLELANFILVADENLLDATSYPELENILPFM